MSDEPGFDRYDCRSDLHGGSTAARAAVERGECVVLPTDTVYGIGADAFSAAAVQRLLAAKGRGRDMPPPVLIGEPRLLQALAAEVPAQLQALVDQHWPGPLTVICRAQKTLQMDLGETRGTIALRVPDHEVARALLRRTGPLAVSSANRSGEPAAVDVDAAVAQLQDRVRVYLDHGPTPGALASSIVDFTTDDDGVLVREGVLSLATLQQVLPGLRLSDALAAAAVGPEETEADPDGTDEPSTEETGTDGTGTDGTETARDETATDGQMLEEDRLGTEEEADGVTSDDIRAAIQGAGDTPTPEPPPDA